MGWWCGPLVLVLGEGGGGRGGALWDGGREGVKSQVVRRRGAEVPCGMVVWSTGLGREGEVGGWWGVGGPGGGGALWNGGVVHWSREGGRGGGW